MRLPDVVTLWALASEIVPPVYAQIAQVSVIPSSTAGLTARSVPSTLPADSIQAIPADGLDIHFSDSTLSALKSAMANSCSNPSSATCQSAVQSALASANYNANQLQARNWYWAGAGLVGILSILLPQWFGTAGPPPDVHVPPTVLSSASAFATATAAAVTPSGGGAVTTVPLASPPKVTQSATISIAPQASGGDLHILMTSQQASALQSVLGQPGLCISSGTSGASCIYEEAKALFFNAKWGKAVFTIFLSAPSTLPGFSDSSVEQLRSSFVTDVLIGAGGLGLTYAAMTAVANEWFYLAYIWVNNDVNISTDNVIAGALLNTSTKGNCPAYQLNPKTTDLICDESYCLGPYSTKFCTQDPYKNCACYPYAGDRKYERYDTQMMYYQPDALTQWLAGGTGGGSSNPITCFSATNKIPAYVTPDTAYNQVTKWCNGLKGTSGNNININNTFWQQTPDYFAFAVTGSSSGDFDTGKCISSMNSILTDCDGVPSNPMNWKWGGTFNTGSLTYTIQPLMNNRLWPAPTSPSQQCTGTYTKARYDQFYIGGAGWASWDYGQQTLYPSITRCTGSAPTAWTFQYYLQDGFTPQDNHFGFEWTCSFRTPIWVRARCFDNNKVQGWAGGPGSGGGGCGGDG